MSRVDCLRMCVWLLHRRVERLGDTLALGVTQRRRLVQEVLGLLPKRGNGLAKLQELLFRVAHQFHKDLALPTALAAKAPHDFFQLLVERLGLARGPWRGGCTSA